MKKICIVLIFLFSFLLYISPVDAHVLVTDKNIGAIFHTDPDDDPIAGQQTGFYFEFKDKTNKFDPSACDCNFAILKNGITLYSQPLFQNTKEPSLTNASVFYTFPQIGSYTVTVTGKPSTSSAFQDFSLSYQVKVNKTTEDTSERKNNFMPWLLGGIIVLVVVSAVTFLLRKKRK